MSFPEGRVTHGNQVFDGDNRTYTKYVAQGSSIHTKATVSDVGGVYDVASETNEGTPRRKGYSFVGYTDNNDNNNDSIITTLA